jgi:endonuclease/exonuclease/phosphatase family metal-dependent hydrolase
MAVEPQIPLCRTVRPADAAVTWITPYDGEDRGKLHAWCAAVGPAVVYVPQNPPTADISALTIVSWNMGVGRGDLDAMMNDIAPPAGQPPQRHIVVLLQEAYRQDDVPAACPARSGVTARISRGRQEGSTDVVAFAARRQMYLVYVPSMRNGKQCDEWPREDRGNAILSTLALSEATAVELPFAQQRRVAVAATVRTAAGDMHLMSVHLDTLLGHRRQGQGIAFALNQRGWNQNVIVAGDFNAWWLDSRVRLTDYDFREIDCSRRATRITGRLDRMYLRGANRPPLNCRPWPAKFGSDHSPLVAEFDVRAQAEVHGVRHPLALTFTE